MFNRTFHSARNNARTLTVLATIATTVACSGTDDDAFPDQRLQGEHQDVAVWMSDDPLIDREAVIDACNDWSPLNVACYPVSDRDDADVFVNVVDDACANYLINGQPAIALMQAAGKRDIRLFRECVTKRHDRIGNAEGWYVFLRGNIKHEFGHIFGGRGHVPFFCDGTDDIPVVTHPSGIAICGGANMNAGNHIPRANPLNQLDFLFLDLRPSGFIIPRDPAPMFPTGDVGQAEQALEADFETCTITDEDD